ncbi:glycosyltransferase family 2 protein [Bradyrhizobium sp. USDA 4529]
MKEAGLISSKLARPSILPKRMVRKVSVVTVTYNAASTLRLTMESVIRQTFPDLDHVVIDGGSTDGTQDIAREYDLGAFVSEKDDGVYDAMEKGAKAARGDIVIFLNAGDTFYDDHVCSDVAKFFEETDADLIFGNIMPVYLSSGDTHDHGAFEPGQLLDLSYVRSRRQLLDESIHHQATFYRRSLFRKCSFRCIQADATGEYHLLAQAVFKHGAKVRYCPRNISRFVLGGISTRDFQSEWARYIKCRDILRQMYMSGPTAFVQLNDSEFHEGPSKRSSSMQLMIDRRRLKAWIKKTFAFKLYERATLGMNQRLINALLPRQMDLQELQAQRIFADIRSLVEAGRHEQCASAAELGRELNKMILDVKALQVDLAEMRLALVEELGMNRAAVAQPGVETTEALRVTKALLERVLEESLAATKNQALGVAARLDVQAEGLGARIDGISRAIESQSHILTEGIQVQSKGISERVAVELQGVVERLGAIQDNATDRLLMNQGALLKGSSDKRDFSDYGFRVFSQWDEDGLIQYLIDRCDIPNRVFVEIGVGDYRESNTRFLLSKDRWSGFAFEGRAEDVSRIQSSDWYWRVPLEARHAFVTAENINELIAGVGLEGDIGLLSIDIDGVDYWIWKALEIVSPRIVVCEYNGIFGREAAVTVPYVADFDRIAQHYSGLYAGSSIAALRHLGTKKGYTFIGTNVGGNNAFFVRNDVLSSSQAMPSKRAFVEPLFREGRRPDGSLSYESLEVGRRLIAEMPLIDVTNGQVVRVSDVVAPV